MRETCHFQKPSDRTTVFCINSVLILLYTLCSKVCSTPVRDPLFYRNASIHFLLYLHSRPPLSPPFARSLRSKRWASPPASPFAHHRRELALGVFGGRSFPSAHNPHQNFYISASEPVPHRSMLSPPFLVPPIEPDDCSGPFLRYHGLTPGFEQMCGPEDHHPCAVGHRSDRYIHLATASVQNTKMLHSVHFTTAL